MEIIGGGGKINKKGPVVYNIHYWRSIKCSFHPMENVISQGIPWIKISLVFSSIDCSIVGSEQINSIGQTY